MRNEELQLLKNVAKKQGVGYEEVGNYVFMTFNEWEYKFNKNNTLKNVMNDLRSESVFIDFPILKEIAIQEKVEGVLKSLESHFNKDIETPKANDTRIVKVTPVENGYTGLLFHKNHQVIFTFNADTEKLEFYPKDKDARPIVKADLDDISDVVSDAIMEMERQNEEVIKTSEVSKMTPRNDYIMDFEL